MSKRVKKFALIWWMDDRKKDVIPLSMVPKKSQVVDAIATLKWNDVKTKRTFQIKAKVLAISDNENQLLRVIVTDEGVIHDESQKIFSQNVIQKEKELKQNKKIAKKGFEFNKKHWDNEIKKTPPIAFNNSSRNGNSGPSATFPTCVVPVSDIRKADITLPSETGYPLISHPAPVDSDNFSYSGALDNSAQNCHEEISTASQTSITQPTLNIPITPYYNPGQMPVQSVAFNYPMAVNNSSNNHYNQSSTTSQTPINQPALNTPTLYYNRSQAPVQTHSCNEPKAVDNFLNLPSTSHTPANKPTFNRKIEELDDSSSCESTSSIHHNQITSLDSEQGIGVLAGIAVGKITQRDIFIQEQLLQAMKRSYENQKRLDLQSEQLITIPDYYFKGDEKMEEISKNCGFYLPKTKKVYLELLAERAQNWKILVRETVLEVYGASIANYSSTGKRTNRPPIDFKLFNGLLEWVNEKFPPVKQKDLIEYISKIAANKRKYRNKTKSGQNSSLKGRKKIKADTQVKVSEEQGFEEDEFIPLPETCEENQYSLTPL